jgi:hypothetical protein
MYINQQVAQNSVHLVGLYTYCKMMHGAYSVKQFSLVTDLRDICIEKIYGVMKYKHIVNE